MATKSEIVEFLRREFSRAKWSVVEAGNASASVRYSVAADDLRPGGTVAGYVLMTVAGIALYVAILGEIGMIANVVGTYSIPPQ